MNTKLTLRIDDALVRQAKTEARRRGKSVSQMFGEFIRGIAAPNTVEQGTPPITSSLVGILKGQRISEADYRKHLREKHL
jgi:hypothetical protein